MSNQPKMPSSIVDAQVQRLLEIVEEYRKQQCDGLLTQAQQDSSQIIRQAYREARSRMHQDIQDSREHMRNELSAARAKLHTLMMQQRHQADQRFLEQSWK
jgi:vacuolar-type H+-ATPase subunit H